MFKDATNVHAEVSESAVVRAVSNGEVQAGVVSVMTLAGHPEAIARGVRAVWLLGEWTREGLLTSCDVSVLATEKLGAVRFSISHYELMGAFAGRPLPEVMLVGDRATLVDAYERKDVTGGQPPTADTTGAQFCSSQFPALASFVVIHRRDQPISGPELSRIASALPRLDDSRVRAFFGGPDSAFAKVFSSAGNVWSQLRLIEAPAPAVDAFDPRFMEGTRLPSPTPRAEETPSPTPSPTTSPAPPERPKYGYPSTWFDF